MSVWLGLIVATLGTARITKLLVEDTFPPAARLRALWVRAFQDSPWVDLFLCAFCMSVWVAAANVAAGWLSDWHTVWWLVNGWLSVAYLAGIIIARDIPNPE